MGSDFWSGIARQELFVKVDKDWQRRPAAVDRLGL